MILGLSKLNEKFQLVTVNDLILNQKFPDNLKQI